VNKMIESPKFHSLRLALFLALIFATLILGGCANSTTTSAKNSFTADQAAELIYHDLIHHGLKVQKVDVSNFTYQDSKTITIDVTYQTGDGRIYAQKATLILENGQWQIKNHDH